MAFKQKKWIDIPDPNNLPDVPVGQDSLAILDANNMNRIEDGIVESMIENNVKNLVFEKITSSCSWVAPKACKQNFKIFCVGGGGGGGRYAGGGGGYVEITETTVPENTEIDVICGAGGSGYSESDNILDGDTLMNGGSTSFGNILTAEGGKGGNGLNGGDGGAGGGACSGGNGGNGSDYGGGGGAGMGGTVAGIGGTYSGNGGAVGVSATEGQSFRGSIVDVLFKFDIIHAGSAGMSAGDKDGGEGGSGGYGGNGGNVGPSGTAGTNYGCGGGGGYCGNGGNSISTSGGGGGGYCGNGGSGGYSTNASGGGGGGFFCDGGYGGYCGGGGGGFFSNGGGSDYSKYGGAGGDGGVLIMYIKED